MPLVRDGAGQVMDFDPDLALAWAALAVLLFWSVGAYNRLVRLRAQAIASFQLVDSRLCQHLKLVESELQDGLATEQAACASEWAGLRDAASVFEAALRAVRRQVLHAPAMAVLQDAHDKLQSSWERLMDARSRLAPPSPLSQTSPCVAAWRDATQLVAHAASEFRLAVQAHNQAIDQFPALLLAMLFGFRPAGYL